MGAGIIFLSQNDPLSQAFGEQCGDSFEYYVQDSNIDIRDIDSLSRIIDASSPTVLINAVDFNDIDTAEFRREEAYRINSTSVKSIAEICARNNTLLVHVSTSCVFDGDSARPYNEEDVPAPISAFGDSKLLGEYNIRTSGENHLIVRIPECYGTGKSPFNLRFVKREHEKSFAVVSGNTVSPVSAVDAVIAILTLIEKGARGTFHAGQEGHATAEDFLSTTMTVLKSHGRDFPDVTVRTIDPKEMALPGDRPLLDVLDLSKYRSCAGATPRHWQQALEHYISINLDTVSP